MRGYTRTSYLEILGFDCTIRGVVEYFLKSRKYATPYPYMIIDGTTKIKNHEVGNDKKSQLDSVYESLVNRGNITF